MADKEAITVLNRKRGALKAHLTRIKAFLENDDKDCVEINIKLDNIRKINNKIEDLRNEYYVVVKDDSELGKLEKELADIEEECEKMEVSFQKLLLTFNKQLSNQNGSNFDKPNELNIKLPDIPLPRFSGNFQEWYTFKEQFKNLIDSNTKLTAAQKLYYLKSTLTGTAADIITLDDTYESLIKTLEERFENKRMIANSHINAILAVELTSNMVISKSLRIYVDHILKHIRSLISMGLELNKFAEMLLINIILKKIDKESRKQYELTCTSNDLPDWKAFIDFLEKRCLVLENLKENTHITEKNIVCRNSKPKSFFVKSNNNSNLCLICRKSQHPVHQCRTFLKCNEMERFNLIKLHNLCINCFSNNHKVSRCVSSRSCDFCQEKHNSLLHRRSKRKVEVLDPPPSRGISTLIADPSKVETEKEIQVNEETETQVLSSCMHHSQKKVLLSTAVIYLQNASGARIPARAVLDCGSQSSLITEEFSNVLGLKKDKHHISITGINGSTSLLKFKLHTIISNKEETFSKSMDFLIIPKITDLTPSSPIDLTHVKIPPNIILADPQFNIPYKIDLLIGAEVFFDILTDGKYNVPNTSLILQNTAFGHVASGVFQSPQSHYYCGFVSEVDTFDEDIRKFWEIENVDETERYLSEEAKYCEKHFVENYRRDDTGRYVVKMPFREDPSVLGNSRDLAERRLGQLCTRLAKNSNLSILYQDFIDEYKNLQHLERVEKSDDNDYYIPHHCIYRPEKSSTKLRVVFNASAPTTSGKSLNDILMSGEVIEDVYDIILRFRKHTYVFIVDIQKMFRQILIDPSQRHLLKILWKKSKDDPVETFQLRTVTYGTTSAPFLAIRTLRQLAVDEEENYPSASKALLTDTYMDDILSGANNLEEAKDLQIQLINILRTAGMELHKWNANHVELLENTTSPGNENYSFLPSSDTKVLGILWKPERDIFSFKVNIAETRKITKRSVLSNIASIFDPLGLIGPIITTAKIFIQKLWIEKLDWNDTLPEYLKQAWLNYINDLKEIENLKIPRQLLIPESDYFVLFGFADASESAYGCVVYLQSVTGTTCSSKLVGSKSSVAPLKKLTIPRLELCACLLLSKFITRILQSLKMEIKNVFLFSDSTISLAWIKTSPHLLKTFVSNRVAKIQALTKDFTWHHINSKENPADLISRGTSCANLMNNDLWWFGPDILKQNFEDIQYKENNMTDKIYFEELKPVGTSTLTVTNDSAFFDDLIDKTNNFHKLIRILSFVFRFYHNAKNRLEKTTSHLTIEEMENSRNVLIRNIQVRYFSNEIANLEKGLEITRNSKLKYFNPFLDENGLIRVGGRLGNSNLDYDKKHPIVLPSSNKLVKLIFTYYHQKYLHVGAQTLLHIVRQIYWPLNGRYTARQVVHNCVICLKAKPKLETQIMGNLPKSRVQQTYPFNVTGIDFCGPFYIRYGHQRKGTLYKVYIAVFVCFTTRAIHFELVSQLTTDSFIAALKRFISRRGKCASIWTDNARNFIGANNELKRMYDLVKSPDEKLSKYLGSEDISWKFIPPRSPHFGGLWEAGVKSFKFHLKRAIGDLKLTYEEFLTVTNQIEGILNSRPISPLSNDSNDIDALTPGHFLIGRPFTTIVEPQLTELVDNRLSRWQRTTKIIQYLWRRWQRDYLNHLHQRSKWYFSSNNIKEGSMVVVKEENMPTSTWLLGRVESVILGNDKKCRVIIIRTKTGLIKRPVSKVCLLPI